MALASDIATISADSGESGLDHPSFGPAMPPELANAGVKADAWNSIVRRANDSVKFNWGVDTILFFLCNAHNRKIGGPMKKFCDEVNGDGSLPAGIKVRYEMATETIDKGVNGSSMQSYHKVIFYQ